MRKHAYKVLRRCHCLDLIIHYISLFFHVFIFYCFVHVRALYALTMYLIYFEKMKDNKNKKEQNLLVFTCCVSFHKYERIDLVAPFLKAIHQHLSNFPILIEE